MKKNILIIAVAIMLLAGFGFGEVTFDKSCKAPDTSLIKNIYKAQLRSLSFAQADRIVQNICGITGDPLVLDNEKSNKTIQYYRTIDNQATCQIDRATGDVFYRKHSKFQGSAPNLPSKANVTVLARNHLTNLGMWKKGMAKPHISTLKDAVSDGQATETFEKMRVVTFTRSLDGMPVLGASRAAVMIGTNGDLEGLVLRWMDVQPTAISSKVPTKAQIKRYIKAKLEARKLDVVVKKVNLIMFDDGKGTMKPMLLIEGDLITSQGKFFSDWMFPVIK
jgi:hypothetical protein